MYESIPFKASLFIRGRLLSHHPPPCHTSGWGVVSDQPPPRSAPKVDRWVGTSGLHGGTDFGLEFKSEISSGKFAKEK